ncbi:unnamed protein product [Symbiodinium natans]|uniref:Uncharacterized protein n=1 Tax=Symbiodinium natans TaxID=878477 RepID=A0A812JMR4_9DINO|nr:unnamed protein product [Symbiodinium natans]
MSKDPGFGSLELGLPLMLAGIVKEDQVLAIQDVETKQFDPSELVPDLPGLHLRSRNRLHRKSRPHSEKGVDLGLLEGRVLAGSFRVLRVTFISAQRLCLGLAGEALGLFARPWEDAWQPLHLWRTCQPRARSPKVQTFQPCTPKSLKPLEPFKASIGVLRICALGIHSPPASYT